MFNQQYVPGELSKAEFVLTVDSPVANDSLDEAQPARDRTRLREQDR